MCGQGWWCASLASGPALLRDVLGTANDDSEARRSGTWAVAVWLARVPACVALQVQCAGAGDLYLGRIDVCGACVVGSAFRERWAGSEDGGAAEVEDEGGKMEESRESKGDVKALSHVRRPTPKRTGIHLDDFLPAYGPCGPPRQPARSNL